VSQETFGLTAAESPDAEALTALYLRSRAAAMPWLASPHDEAATHWWMENVVIPEQLVRVAREDRRPLGFFALTGNWLEQLYVDPDDQGRGVGRLLLEEAKRLSPDGLSLYVFTRNGQARRFYEAAGFMLTAQSDGTRNEEREPDCLYRWRPAPNKNSRGSLGR
jgi:GNAT superfamily N-acetyltransferase